MRHLLFLVIFSFGFGNMAKADNIPFVQDGKQWMYFGSRPETNPYKKEDGAYYGTYYYYLQGDTIIGDISCLKLYYEEERGNLSELYEGAMYEEEGRVYFIPEGKTTAALLYDFSCQVGDSIETFGGTMMVENIKTVGYDGKTYKVISVQDTKSWTGAWIEGVGSKYDLLALTCPDSASVLLRSCEMEDEMNFRYPTDFMTREAEGAIAEMNIGGLNYRLYSDYTALVTNGNQREGELEIPEQVFYHDEAYTVSGLEWLAFSHCETLTKVMIPKTISRIESYAWSDCKTPFVGCTALESIEVDEENPWMCSVDGVFFNKEGTWLYSYPAGLKREVYDIPEGVERIGMDAFANNPYLISVYMPNSVTHMDSGAFSNCKNLYSIRISENIEHIQAYTFERCENLHYLDIPENVSSFEEGVFRWSPIKTLIIRGTFPEELRRDTFYAMDEERTVIYVRKSEIEKFKKVFSGTVLPLEEYVASDIKSPGVSNSNTSHFYDLTGRPVAAPAKGIYIKDGKKVMVK